MPKSAKAWKIATAACKKKGRKSFKAGTAGDRCRKKIAEKIGEK